MNTWKIPDWLEQEVRARDKNCVYCGVRMLPTATPGQPRKTLATWEHIINNARIITRENIALCCSSCNASKGAKPLAEWLQSRYCRERGINQDTVAPIIKSTLPITR